jgi:hypothetical protein
VLKLRISKTEKALGRAKDRVHVLEMSETLFGFVENQAVLTPDRNHIHV